MLYERRRFAAASLVTLVSAGLSACAGGPALARQHEANRRASALRIDFKKATDASNLAVLADTDESSVAFASDADAAKKSVREGVEALKPLLHGLGFQDEESILDEFIERLAAYEAMDRTVLDLAVENTNRKAQRLAFGPGRTDANAVRSSLEAAAKGAPSDKSCSVASLTATAIIAVREIQVLQHQHIAEADDATMDTIEKEMTALQTSARTALQALSAEGVSATDLSNATKALERFGATHTSLVALSRKNSNVRSTALSLGEKLTLASACEVSLEALATALARRTTTATR